jgi:hypothetical protein
MRSTPGVSVGVADEQLTRVAATLVMAIAAMIELRFFDISYPLSFMANLHTANFMPSCYQVSERITASR